VPPSLPKAPPRLADGLAHVAKKCSTPANDVRARHQRAGWPNLTTDEQAWSLVDRTVNVCLRGGQASRSRCQDSRRLVALFFCAYFFLKKNRLTSHNPP
jgi:hypothetical protein